MTILSKICLLCILPFVPSLATFVDVYTASSLEEALDLNLLQTGLIMLEAVYSDRHAIIEQTKYLIEQGKRALDEAKKLFLPKKEEEQEEKSKKRKEKKIKKNRIKRLKKLKKLKPIARNKAFSIFESESDSQIHLNRNKLIINKSSSLNQIDTQSEGEIEIIIHEEKETRNELNEIKHE